jgi:hypothetical protein
VFTPVDPLLAPQPHWPARTIVGVPNPRWIVGISPRLVLGAEDILDQPVGLANPLLVRANYRRVPTHNPRRHQRGQAIPAISGAPRLLLPFKIGAKQAMNARKRSLAERVGCASSAHPQRRMA